MARKALPITEIFSPESPAATEFRRLLHRILARPDAAKLKSLMFTSAMVSEGKSTICAFMGVVAAREHGLKTLIVDCDLRRPTMHRLFCVDREPGVTEILTDDFASLEAVKKTNIDRLDLIPSGQQVSEPAAVFEAEAIGCLLDNLKMYYDLILIDTAPLLPVSDPMLLASKVDGIFLIVKAGSTKREVVRRSVELLSSDRNRILGVVVNNLKRSLPFYYNYNYYDYGAGPSLSKPDAASIKKARRLSSPTKPSRRIVR